MSDHLAMPWLFDINDELKCMFLLLVVLEISFICSCIDFFRSVSSESGFRKELQAVGVSEVSHQVERWRALLLAIPCCELHSAVRRTPVALSTSAPRSPQTPPFARAAPRSLTSAFSRTANGFYETSLLLFLLTLSSKKYPLCFECGSLECVHVT